jgi:hypothetical protein
MSDPKIGFACEGEGPAAPAVLSGMRLEFRRQDDM